MCPVKYRFSALLPCSESSWFLWSAMLSCKAKGLPLAWPGDTETPQATSQGQLHAVLCPSQTEFNHLSYISYAP